MIQNISYKNYRKKDDIHGTVLYPAVMVAPIQKEILRDLIDANKRTKVFDPFHGSGTALYECIEISRNVELYGCDINPFANLITKTKLAGVTDSICEDILNLTTSINSCEDAKRHTFNNIDKWFRDDIQYDLSIIRESIQKISCKQNRLFFWCMFADIIRRYSNTRSSTYKLHSKETIKVEGLINNSKKDFIASINQNYKKYLDKSENFTLYKCDTIQKIKDFDKDFFDISITSPPYGENATTVPYGQFSILALMWIPPNDLELEGWEFDNFSCIDSKSVGGKETEMKMDDFSVQLLNPYIAKISESKQRKVVRFFSEYFYFLKELCRVTKQHIVLTLGNRTVDGVTIDLTDISLKYLESQGFKNKYLLEREIPNKRTPRTTSKVNNQPIQSINSEYVIIHEKEASAI